MPIAKFPNRKKDRRNEHCESLQKAHYAFLERRGPFAEVAPSYPHVSRKAEMWPNRDNECNGDLTPIDLLLSEVPDIGVILERRIREVNALGFIPTLPLADDLFLSVARSDIKAIS